MFLQELANAISLGSVYALFALGFTLIFGVMGVINLSHGTVFMLGTYTGWFLVSYFHLPLWLAVPAGMLASAGVGFVIDRIVLKPLRARNAPHLIPMVATIGVGIFITSVVQGTFGAENQRFPVEATPVIGFNLGDVYVSLTDVVTVAVTALLMAALIVILRYSKQGMAMRAVAENKRVSLLLGINVERLFAFVSLCAGALGGAAGILFGISYNAITPLMGQSVLDKGIAVIILGGLGDIRGAVVGGLLLGFAEVYSVAYLSSGFRDAVSFGLLFLILLIRPSGIFGKPLARKD